MAEAGVEFLELNTKLEDPGEILALDSVIGEILDEGNVAAAVRLQGLFSHKHKVSITKC